MMRFAETAGGAKVPILDYTQEVFRHRPPTAIQNLGSLAVLRGLKWMSPSGREWLGKKSLVLKNLLLRENRFVSGPATYLAKLGPRAAHLSKLDKLAAGSVQSIESARRGFATAQLESEILLEIIGGETPSTRIEYFNIGGGPASDNLNSLLLLAHDRPDAFARLREIPVAIRVLDSDSEGFVLGRNSLDVLSADGGPLAGVAISMTCEAYDWARTPSLEALLNDVTGDLIVSAEGSLFEYGSDDEVAANLAALRRHRGKSIAVVGSAFRRHDEISLVARRLSGISPQLGWRFRGVEGVQSIAARAGWVMDRITTNNSIYFTFVLRPTGN